MKKPPATAKRAGLGDRARGDVDRLAATDAAKQSSTREVAAAGLLPQEGELFRGEGIKHRGRGNLACGEHGRGGPGDDRPALAAAVAGAHLPRGGELINTAVEHTRKAAVDRNEGHGRTPFVAREHASAGPRHKEPKDLFLII